MMTPYKPGDRVVVRVPEPTIGVVRWVTPGNLVGVDADGETSVWQASEVRPAMPRDPGDLNANGKQWWRNGVSVLVDGTHDWLWWSVDNGKMWAIVSKLDKWTGPVDRSPEVKS